MELTISLAQMDIALGQPQVNLAKVQELTAEAKRLGSDVVLFPELWSTGYDLENAEQHATSLNEGLFAELAALARENAIHICGSLLSVQDGRYHNTAPLFSPAGKRLGHYSKIHLFRPMEEAKYLAAGQAAPVFDLPWGKSAIAICYDLRFPELFRSYALAGAKIVFLLAAWPYPRLEHWRTLLQARAIENQLFIVACNRVGESKGERFFGHSAIYDPWGKLVIAAGDGEALLTASVDMALVEEVRQTITVFADRRPELY
jgi:predicted amidohydrolase